MTTYYDDAGVLVTSHELVVDAQRYELSELHGLRIVRGEASPAGRICALLAVLFVLPGSCTLQTAAWTVGIGLSAVGVLALGAAALIIRRLRPRPYELWAQYRGHTVQLLWRPDERTFNAIRFAILRAKQADRLTS